MTSPRCTDTLNGSMQWRLKRPRGGLWSHPDFMKLWIGQSISEFGTPVSQIAIPWIAIKIIKASAFEVIVPIVLSPIPGLREFPEAEELQPAVIAGVADAPL